MAACHTRVHTVVHFRHHQQKAAICLIPLIPSVRNFSSGHIIFGRVTNNRPTSPALIISDVSHLLVRILDHYLVRACRSIVGIIATTKRNVLKLTMGSRRVNSNFSLRSSGLSAIRLHCGGATCCSIVHRKGNRIQDMYFIDVTLHHR